jgi:hypothetical protein
MSAIPGEPLATKPTGLTLKDGRKVTLTVPGLPARVEPPATGSVNPQNLRETIRNRCTTRTTARSRLPTVRRRERIEAVGSRRDRTRRTATVLLSNVP